MKKRKWMSFFAIVMCVSLLLASCGTKPKKKTETIEDIVTEDVVTPVTEEVTEQIIEDVVERVSKTSTKTIISEEDIIGSDGTFKYPVVYGAAATDPTVSAEIVNLVDQIAHSFDIETHCGDDTEMKQSTYELLLGETNRAESKQALAALAKIKSANGNDTANYLIKRIGGKICIVGGSDLALAQAIRYFNTAYCHTLRELAPVMDKDFSFSHVGKFTLKGYTVAGSPLAQYKIVVPKSHSVLWTRTLETFTKRIRADYGLQIKSVKDTTAATAKEIVIGNTTRAAAPAKGYEIKVANGKMYVNGADDIQICKAIQLLIEDEQKAAVAGKAVSYPNGYKKTGVAEKNTVDYYLSWGDEFNGTELDRSIWVNWGGNSQTEPRTTPSCTGGTAYKMDAMECTVSDGELYVPCKRLSHEDFTHGQPTTNGTVASRYGVIEWRVKIPQYPITTALWGYFTDYILTDEGKVENKSDLSMELDVNENFADPRKVGSCVHNWATTEDDVMQDTTADIWLPDSLNGLSRTYTYKGEDTLCDDWHIYSCIWTPYEISFALDGDIYYSYDLTKVEGSDFTRARALRWMIGAAYGAAEYGPKEIPDDAPLEDGIHCDWFRIYQTDMYDSWMFITPVGSKFF